MGAVHLGGLDGWEGHNSRLLMHVNIKVKAAAFGPFKATNRSEIFHFFHVAKQKRRIILFCKIVCGIRFLRRSEALRKHTSALVLAVMPNRIRSVHVFYCVLVYSPSESICVHKLIGLGFRPGERQHVPCCMQSACSKVNRVVSRSPPT